VNATPHYHTHTTRFTAYATINGEKKMILEQYGKLGRLPEPELIYFDSVAKNPIPNATAEMPGGSSGILNMKPGDKLDWECEITNDNVPEGIKFANEVYTAEMCNLFGLYAPSIGQPWYGLNP